MDGRSVTPGSVHVWTVGLDVDPAGVAACLDLLSGEERVRAARLRTTELRLRFVVGHGALRSILAWYIGIKPQAIRLDVAESGKPFVADGAICFNLAHSEDLAVCAIASEGRLGVDVERIRPVPDADAIAHRYFAPSEALEYAATSHDKRTATFFSIWTRKEALVKAAGGGQEMPLDSFGVEIAPSIETPRVSIDPARGQWHLHSFEPAAGYAGAVASDRPVDTLHVFEWTGTSAAGITVEPLQIRELRSARSMS